jgi:ATP-dependent Lon protease
LQYVYPALERHLPSFTVAGRVIQAVRKAGVRDPLLLLDEVDKMGRDAARGDPSAALLEVRPDAGVA